MLSFTRYLLLLLSCLLAVLAPSAFAQTLPALSGLRLHLKADAGVTSSGGVVSAWADQSGNGFNVAATGSQQPAFAASAVNGLPALTLDGSDDFLASTASVDLLGGQANYTFYAVTKAGATQKTNADIFDYNHGFGQRFTVEMEGLNRFANTNNGIGGTLQTLPAGAFSIYGGTSQNGGNLTSRLNGGNQLTASGLTAAFGASTFEVGNCNCSGREFNGQIAEILIYNRVLTGVEQQQVEAYLSARYAITLNTPPFGNVVQLNGVDDAVTSAGPAYTANDNFTLEAWVKPTLIPTAGFEAIVGNSFDDGTVGNGVALGIGSGTGGGGGSNLVVLFSGLAFFNTGISFPTAGQWYHVAVTRRSGTTFAYLDGVQAPNTTSITPAAIQSSGGFTSRFRVGSQNSIRFLHGQVDEARAWSVGRTQAEIQSTMGDEVNAGTAGLAANWRFNRSGQGAGLVIQSHVTANPTFTGTTVGTATTPVFTGTLTDNAVLLNGTTDGISLPTNAALTFGAASSFTIESLVKTTTTIVPAGEPKIFSQQRCTAGVIQLSVGADGIVHFRVGDVNNNEVIVDGPIINDGLWHQVAGVRDVAADQIRLFVDGVLVAQATDPTTGAITAAATENWLGQRFPCANKDFFTGSLDEFRIWNVARTQAQIQNRMNQTLNGNETGLALYYDMNRSGQGAALTVTNGATGTGTALDGTTVGTGSTPVFSLANNPGVVAAAPTISSFTPTSGPVGTVVTVNGNNFAGATSGSFNGTTTTIGTVVSATQVQMQVPAGATTGTISVTTPRGTGTSSGTFTVTLPRGLVTGTQGVHYDFNTAGLATDLSGNGRDGTLAGGATISGGLLAIGANASDVLIVPGAAFNNLQDFTVTATVRMASFGSYNQLIMGTTTGGNDFGVGYAKGTNQWSMTINGTDVAFGSFVATIGTTYQIVATRRGNQASFFVDGAQVGTTQTVGAGAISIAATGLVIGQDQDALGGGFDATQCWAGSIDEIAMYRSAFTPLTVGAALTVPFTSTGPAFTAGNTYTVQLSNAAGSFAAPTVLGTVAGTGSSSISTTVPSVPSGSGYRIRVLASAPAFTGDDDGGQPIVITNNTPPATDLTFFPTSGSPGSVVLVTKGSGADFTTATSARFNGAAATGTTFNTATQVTATVPNGATTGVLTTLTGATTLTGGTFTVTSGTGLPAPVLRNFSPVRAPVGTVLALFGANFNGVTAVRFGTTNAPGFVVQSANGILVPVPAGAQTGDRIYVLAAGGMAQSMRPFTLIPPPTLSATFPSFGTAQALVQLTGTNLTNATSVSFNGTDATAFTVNSATSITATIPVGATTGPITVTTVAGTATAPGSFTVNTTPAAPSISGFSPASGNVGTAVTLTGTSLTGATLVRFGALAGTGLTPLSATQVRASVPAGAVSAPLWVLTPGGLAQSATSFSVTTPTSTVPAPTLTSLLPTFGTPGAQLLLTGTNLSGATAVSFNGTAATFSGATATGLTAVVPAGATTGLVRVTTAGGQSNGLTFTVTAPTPPTLVSFSPTSGPVGTVVTVSGSNFSGATGAVLNGATVAVSNVTAGSLTFTVPAGGKSGLVGVIGPGGLRLSAAPFTVVPAPTVTSFSPASGSPGSAVELTGTNLTGATAVTFGGVHAPVFTVNSATSITVTVPAGAATGVLGVTTPGGAGASSGPFTVTVPAAPTISGLSPASGIIGAVVQISGTNLLGTSSVRVNGKAVETFVIFSATLVLAQIPDGATTGPISLSTSGGQAVSPTDYTILTTPEIDALTPVRGPVGTVVTLVGEGFTGTTALTVGGVSVVSFAVVNDKKLTATVPTGALSGQLALTTPVAVAVSAQPFTVTGMRVDSAHVTAANAARLGLYPNPASGTVTVYLQDWQTGATPPAVELYDALGRRLRRVVFPDRVTAATAPIELLGVPAGVYIVRCGPLAQRLVVE